jgi:hypothetical protein
VKYYIIPVLFILTLFSCKEERKRDPLDWRSPQYIQDSTICSDYMQRMDTILLNLPAGIKMQKQCPGEIKRSVKIFKDGQPYMIFEPQELDTRGSYCSFFRYIRVQKDLHPGVVFFSWTRFRDGYDSQETRYFTLASEIREVIDNKYICVFVNDSKQYVKPELDPIKKVFTPGEIGGTAIIVDFAAGKPICSFSVHAFNSDSVHVETAFEGSDYAADTGVLGDLAGRASRDGVVVDLWHNLAAEIDKKLNEATPE